VPAVPSTDSPDRPVSAAPSQSLSRTAKISKDARPAPASLRPPRLRVNPSPPPPPAGGLQELGAKPPRSWARSFVETRCNSAGHPQSRTVGARTAGAAPAIA